MCVVFMYMYILTHCICIQLMLICPFHSSGDGSLSVLDMRKKGTECRSDSSESELLCLSLVKVGVALV